MTQLVVLLVFLFVLFPVAYMWIGGIDYMNKNHPDYKGEDLFDEEIKDKNNTK